MIYDIFFGYIIVKFVKFNQVNFIFLGVVVSNKKLRVIFYMKLYIFEFFLD